MCETGSQRRNSQSSVCIRHDNRSDGFTKTEGLSQRSNIQRDSIADVNHNLLFLRIATREGSESTGGGDRQGIIAEGFRSTVDRIINHRVNSRFQGRQSSSTVLNINNNRFDGITQTEGVSQRSDGQLHSVVDNNLTGKSIILAAVEAYESNLIFERVGRIGRSFQRGTLDSVIIEGHTRRQVDSVDGSIVVIEDNVGQRSTHAELLSSKRAVDFHGVEDNDLDSNGLDRITSRNHIAGSRDRDGQRVIFIHLDLSRSTLDGVIDQSQASRESRCRNGCIFIENSNRSNLITNAEGLSHRSGSKLHSVIDNNGIINCHERTRRTNNIGISRNCNINGVFSCRRTGNCHSCRIKCQSSCSRSEDNIASHHSTSIRGGDIDRSDRLTQTDDLMIIVNSNSHRTSNKHTHRVKSDEIARAIVLGNEAECVFTLGKYSTSSPCVPSEGIHILVLNLALIARGRAMPVHRIGIEGRNGDRITSANGVVSHRSR